MLTTNLLPQREKAAVKHEELRRVVLFFAAGLVVIISIGIVLLIPPYLLVFVEQQELERQFAIEEDASGRLSTGGTSAKIQGANSMLRSLRAAPDTARASFIFDNIFQRAGTTLSIKELMVRDGGEVGIKGTAQTRRDLLDFEEALRASGIFQDISSPLSNIIKETDIDFNIEGRLKPEYGL